MGKVIITCVITVDGLIESPVPKPDGWLILEGDHEPPEFEMFQRAAGMLIGRKITRGSQVTGLRCPAVTGGAIY